MPHRPPTYTSKVTKVFKLKTMTEYYRWEASDGYRVVASGNCDTKEAAESSVKAYIEFMTDSEKAAEMFANALGLALEQLDATA